MAGLDRREFLKLLGMAGLTAAGCSSETPDKLIPFNEPAADIVTGKPTWFAATCRECPAGCGLLAKNLDGRVIKLEGNPLHPVNRGALCPRGQAALHGLYNPDRFFGPQEKNQAGLLEPVSWEETRTRLADRLRLIAASGRGQRVAMIAPAMTGSLKDLAVHYLAMAGSKNLIIHEPLTYEPLRAANAAVFGVEAIPRYRFDQADFILSLGAGFLETWLSNVEYARQFADFHAPAGPDKHFFAYVGPRQSLTAAGADFTAYMTPGNEYLIALGLLRILLEDGRTRELPPEVATMLQNAAGSVQIQDVAGLTGVSKDNLRALARKFSEAKVPLAVADGLPYAGPNAAAAAVAANLLCLAHPGSAKAIDFNQASVLSGCSTAQTLRDLSEKMKRGEIDLLLLWGGQPGFLPARVVGIPEESGSRAHGGQFLELPGRNHVPGAPGAALVHASGNLGRFLAPAGRIRFVAAGHGPGLRRPEAWATCSSPRAGWPLAVTNSPGSTIAICSGIPGGNCGKRMAAARPSNFSGWKP